MDPLIFTSPTLLPLVQQTSLNRCTDLTRGDGFYRLDRRWPSLSTGEEVLWDLLATLARHDRVTPELERRLSHLDVEHMATVTEVLGAVAREVFA